MFIKYKKEKNEKKRKCKYAKRWFNLEACTFDQAEGTGEVFRHCMESMYQVFFIF